jgi:AcrR family transcriptional regulator
VTLRADARQNRAELLDVAREVIAEQGTDASLRDIARRAGVGIGTLYRHFPTREALLAEIVRTGTERMRARAAELTASKPPGEALAVWLTELAGRLAPYEGMPGSLLHALISVDSALGSACGGMIEAGRELFAAAQTAGAVRPDARWDDVFTATTAVSWAICQSARQREVSTASPDSAALAGRLMTLLLDGLRPEAS